MTGQELFEKLQHVKVAGNTCLYTLEKCNQLAPLVEKIQRLKTEKDAIILAHSYVSPDILYTVADYYGDSYELSLKAKENDSSLIVYAAVKFMAETAKIINPKKDIYIVADDAGCSLADSIDSAEVSKLKKAYPDHSFICYINTTAEVKALCDACVTSSNAKTVITNFPNDKIYFLPDALMAANLQRELKAHGVNKQIDYFDGNCYVHKAYQPEMIDYMRLKNPDLAVIAHPECNPAVAEKADFVGSTSQMIRYADESAAKDFFMLTECGLTSRLQVELSDKNKNFIGMCTLCRYMKSNRLQSIFDILSAPESHSDKKITLDEKVLYDAKKCIDQMFRYS